MALPLCEIQPHTGLPGAIQSPGYQVEWAWSALQLKGLGGGVQRDRLAGYQFSSSGGNIGPPGVQGAQSPQFGVASPPGVARRELSCGNAIIEGRDAATGSGGKVHRVNDGGFLIDKRGHGINPCDDPGGCQAGCETAFCSAPAARPGLWHKRAAITFPGEAPPVFFRLLVLYKMNRDKVR